VHVCVYEREREREKERGWREREKESSVKQSMATENHEFKLWMIHQGSKFGEATFQAETCLISR